jgi:putative transposase
MASHVFSEIYLHINWHTEGDLPSLKADVENFVHTHIKNRCKQTKGVFFEGIGGTETHIHLAIRIEPFVVISDLVGDLKGASSFDANASSFDANKQFKNEAAELAERFLSGVFWQEAVALGAGLHCRSEGAPQQKFHSCKAGDDRRQTIEKPG